MTLFIDLFDTLVDPPPPASVLKWLEESPSFSEHKNQDYVLAGFAEAILASQLEVPAKDLRDFLLTHEVDNYLDIPKLLGLATPASGYLQSIDQVIRLRSFLNENSQLAEGAFDFLRRQKELGNHLYLITNLNSFQKSIIDRLELSPFFDELFLSCEVGWRKPDIRFFQKVLNSNPDFEFKNSCIIGDNWHSDILPVIENGGRAFYLDKGASPLVSQILQKGLNANVLLSPGDKNFRMDLKTSKIVGKILPQKEALTEADLNEFFYIGSEKSLRLKAFDRVFRISKLSECGEWT